MKRSLSSVVVLLIWAAADAADSSPPPPLRVAAFAVAGLAEGMTSADVRRVLGQSQSVTTEDDFRDPGAKLVVWRYGDLLVLLGSQDSVRGVWLRTRRVSTPRGLRVGDPVSRVERLYGAAFRDATTLERGVRRAAVARHSRSREGGCGQPDLSRMALGLT